MSGEELALFITVTAISAAQNMTDEELELFAVVFTQLADTFATLAIIRSQTQNDDDSEL